VIAHLHLLRARAAHYAGINTFILKRLTSKDVNRVGDLMWRFWACPTIPHHLPPRHPAFGPRAFAVSGPSYTPYNYEMGVDLRRVHQALR